MAFAKLALTTVGILAILIGLIWIGQGTGLFPYPATSFMINQTPWIVYGALVAIAGALLLWSGRRINI
ncbi:hypothetical protein [Rhizobium sp. LC145]|jgi:hypothetical protein|uniref:hypothetical protein n=1 Tax=Rhizobium sp. LC145 TaxID=1120688 RepID=UPI000629E379|nr:hypothetical protein [Rhizobium sp. LC145]KKX28026.1 membrane protein [Rhizobium sp. LC145]TKT46336.1 hypothetical protein FDR95_22895 [Rhizobiaceae bacterium LC148]